MREEHVPEALDLEESETIGVLRIQTIMHAQFKGTKTCGHVMTGKGTSLKTSNFLSIFPNEAPAYFVITAPPI